MVRGGTFCQFSSCGFCNQQQGTQSMSRHHFHAVMWIDHDEARAIHFGPEDVDTLVPRPDHPTRNIHHKSNTTGSGHDDLAPEFLRAAAQATHLAAFSIAQSLDMEES
jgi:hypothetical protein